MTTNTYAVDYDKSLIDNGHHSFPVERNKSRRQASDPRDLSNYDSCEDVSDELWTINCLSDKLVYRLATTNRYRINKFTKEIHIIHKYYDQAEWVLYRINIYKPPPQFVINLSDLTTKLKKEIIRLKSTPIVLKKVVTDAVRRLLEAVNPEYYHVNGIYGKVKWRLEP